MLFFCLLFQMSLCIVLLHVQIHCICTFKIHGYVLIVHDRSRGHTWVHWKTIDGAGQDTVKKVPPEFSNADMKSHINLHLMHVFIFTLTYLFLLHPMQVYLLYFFQLCIPDVFFPFRDYFFPSGLEEYIETRKDKVDFALVFSLLPIG